MSPVNGSMQAALLYGPRHVALETIPVPPLGDTDILVRIEAATTCGTDLKVFLQGGHARMITPPAVFGHEFSGTIAQVGARVQHFQRGYAGGRQQLGALLSVLLLSPQPAESL